MLILSELTFMRADDILQQPRNKREVLLTLATPQLLAHKANTGAS